MILHIKRRNLTERDLRNVKANKRVIDCEKRLRNFKTTGGYLCFNDPTYYHPLFGLMIIRILEHSE